MGITELSAVDAILIAGSGLATVFIALGCLALLITLISKVVALFEKPKVTAPSPATSVAPAQKVCGQTYGDEVLLIDVDEKTAACIMAIVSEQTGIDLSELVFKKIRAL